MSELAQDLLYQDVILGHARAPVGYGNLDGAVLTRNGVNPLCGDEIEIDLKSADDGSVVARFRSRGCALCRASASVMMEHIAGCQADEVSRRVSDFCRSFGAVGQGGVSERASAAASDDAVTGKAMRALMSMRSFATRTRCVLLPWQTLGDLLADYRRQQQPG